LAGGAAISAAVGWARDAQPAIAAPHCVRCSALEAASGEIVAYIDDDAYPDRCGFGISAHHFFINEAANMRA